MIYKIQSVKENATDIFNIVENMGDVMFIHDTFYISSILEKVKIKNKIKKSLSKDSDFMVTEINKDNLYIQPTPIQSWVKDKLIKEELLKYESDNQDILKKFNTVIDLVYEEFENQTKGVTYDNSKE